LGAESAFEIHFFLHEQYSFLLETGTKKLPTNSLYSQILAENPLKINRERKDIHGK